MGAASFENNQPTSMRIFMLLLNMAIYKRNLDTNMITNKTQTIRLIVYSAKMVINVRAEFF